MGARLQHPVALVKCASAVSQGEGRGSSFTYKNDGNGAAVVALQSWHAFMGSILWSFRVVEIASRPLAVIVTLVSSGSSRR